MRDVRIVRDCRSTSRVWLYERYETACALARGPGISHGGGSRNVRASKDKEILIEYRRMPGGRHVKGSIRLQQFIQSFLDIRKSTSQRNLKPIPIFKLKPEKKKGGTFCQVSFVRSMSLIIFRLKVKKKKKTRTKKKNKINK